MQAVIYVPSRKLTFLHLKKRMVGSDYFAFGARPIFRGYVACREGIPKNWLMIKLPNPIFRIRTSFIIATSHFAEFRCFVFPTGYIHVPWTVFQHLGVEGFRSHFGENGCLRMSAMLLARELTNQSSFQFTNGQQRNVVPALRGLLFIRKNKTP